MKKAALAIALVAGGFVPLLLGALVVHQGSGGGAPEAVLDRSSAFRGGPVPGSIELPAFRLRSYRGGYVRSRDLRGKVAVVTFLDTRCTTKCPIIATLLADAIRRLPRPVRADTVAIAISVDPEHDTPESVNRFLRRRRARGTFDFLLGTEKELRPVWRAFYVLAASQTGNPDIHSADVRVFDPRGAWVSILHEGVDLTPGNVVHDVETALEEGKTS